MKRSFYRNPPEKKKEIIGLTYFWRMPDIDKKRRKV
jgi:hypothetical protein